MPGEAPAKIRPGGAQMAPWRPDGDTDRSTVLVDAHVHHYPCFADQDMYAAADCNLAAAAEVLGVDPWAPRCLLLAETARDDHFRTLAAGRAIGSAWRAEPTRESRAVRLTREGRPPLLVLAGQQIVTAEGLEVLALLREARIEDGQRLTTTLDLVLASGAVAILPWGFGKWLGQRGRLVDETLREAADRLLFLGDNGGRPRFWPRPRAFRRAAQANVFILPGSDPLPLSFEANRPGSYGFVLDGPFDPERPAASLVRLLDALERQPPPFGRRVGAGRFARSQLGLRLAKTARSGLAHDTRTPDIETASEGYAERFSGPVGRFFLDVQQRLVLRLLDARPGERLRILEVGGGHAQLTPAFLAAGHEVVVQGSAPACGARLRELVGRYPDRLSFAVSDLCALPFAARSFDAVVAVRLLAHVERHQDLVAEMARVSRRRLIVDFPPLFSANLLEPLMFVIKRRLEGNTRPFFCYRTAQLDRALAACGFRRRRTARQFFLPMVIHRAAKLPRLSAALERACRTLGLTASLGAPSLLAAEPAGPGGGRQP